MLLYYTNMFQSHLWPSTGCLITNIPEIRKGRRVKWHVVYAYPEYLYLSTSLSVILQTAHWTFATSIPEIFRVPWLHRFPKTRNTDSQTTFRSGRPEGGVARSQLAERVAEVIAMVSNTAVHKWLLKGLRKLFQFVDKPGFLMYTEDLTKQADRFCEC